MAHKFRNLALESYAYREGKHAYNNQEEKTDGRTITKEFSAPAPNVTHLDVKI